MKTLVLEGVGQTYIDSHTGRSVEAVGNVDFEVPEGQFVSIIGPSGCGKTTVLNMIAGFVPPAKGVIRVGDVPVVGPSPDRGVVFQSFALFPWMTIESNISFGLKMAGTPKEERRKVAQDMVDLVGLQGFEAKYPHELSGGMRQRAGVARVLATEPSIMLMDEPFASIDAQTRRTLQQEVLNIWGKKQTTVIFVTHDVEEAIFMSDRVVVLSGRPSEVLADIEVNIPRPRAWADVEESPEFVGLRSELLGLLGVAK